MVQGLVHGVGGVVEGVEKMVVQGVEKWVVKGVVQKVVQKGAVIELVLLPENRIIDISCEASAIV